MRILSVGIVRASEDSCNNALRRTRHASERHDEKPHDCGLVHDISSTVYLRAMTLMQAMVHQPMSRLRPSACSRQNETVAVIETVRGAPSHAAFSVMADR